ncbi:MAG: sugar phosphate isomerase/epimerase [Verrucomicrobiota bacterium]|nr:sugar phosphate isomerase/epimerase [Verrucomicrobiota bacterium]
MQTQNLSRRCFLKSLAAAGGAGACGARIFAQTAPPAPPGLTGRRDTTLLTKTPPKIKLGLDNFAVRAMGWKAPQLIDYAASLKLDTLFISDLDAYDNLEEAPLREVKAKADSAGLELYVGSWSVCPTSKSFKNKWGTAEEHLALGIRVARTLGSPVFRVILGNAEDRKTEGGIHARIADMATVLKAGRGRALDAGVKIAVENHAGDMHSWELEQLVKQAGEDFVGVNIDSGNAAWTLEDPHDVLERLGQYVLCSSLRDNMIWETSEGAAVRWTAAGDGLIDWKGWARRWAELCPKVPIHIETISGSTRQFPFKKEEFWQYYDKRPGMLEKFAALARRGRELPSRQVPEGVDKKKDEQEYQRAEFERSIKYLREQIGLGVKT